MIQRNLTALIASLLILSSCSNNSANETRPVRKNITELVFAPGSLETDDQYDLTAQTDGYLVEVNFKEGKLVNKGDLLAVIDNRQNIIESQSASRLHAMAKKNTLTNAPALLQIQANIIAAAAKLKLDKEQADRYRRLYENSSVSRTEYDNARLTLTNSQATLDALQQQYRDQEVKAREQEVTQRYASEVNQVISHQNRLTALHSGKVLLKQKQAGDYVRKGEVIATIGNMDSIYARLNVDEANLFKLKTGQTIIIRLNSNKSKVYRAVLRQILPAFNEASRSFLIKAYFLQEPDLLITGTQLEANIVVGIRKNAMVIPARYLGYNNKVTLKAGKETVSVRPGIVATDWVEIISGLRENDVITAPQP